MILNLLSETPVRMLPKEHLCVLLMQLMFQLVTHDFQLNLPHISPKMCVCHAKETSKIQKHQLISSLRLCYDITLG